MARMPCLVSTLNNVPMGFNGLAELLLHNKSHMTYMSIICRVDLSLYVIWYYYISITSHVLIFIRFQVGYETIHNSEDLILKQDMPPALQRVEEASVLLLQASDMLRVDPYSAPARKKLIEGSRGKCSLNAVATILFI